MGSLAEPLYQKLKLWEFKGYILVEPSEQSGAQCLKIDETGVASLYGGTSEAGDALSRPVAIAGLLGVIHLLAGAYAVVITSSESAGLIRGQPVYKITGTKVISFGRATSLIGQQKNDEERYLHLLRKALAAPGLFFSYTSDLTLSSQQVAQLKENKPLWQRADERFVWNLHLLESLTEHKGLDRFILPVMQGSVHTLQYNGLKNTPLHYSIVARRGCSRIGTRMWRRGADTNGATANFVETETILEASGTTAAFVQVRGSIPVFWEQQVNLTWKPKPKVALSEENSRVLSLHFKQLTSLYGGVIACDLVNSKGAESLIGKAFQQEVEKVGPDVRYEAFDFHKICGHTHFEKVELLYSKIRDMLEKQFGYFLATSSAVKRLQKGVVRTNCVDCLDRTNVFQSLLARRTLENQLREIGLSGENELITEHSVFDQKFKTMWADHGDDISMQYAGTGALKGDFVRIGKRTKQGLIQDGVNALTRYWLNNFQDGHRQDSLDLITGHYKVSSKKVSPFRGGGGAQNAAIVVGAFLVSAFLALSNLRGGFSEARLLSWAFMYTGFTALTYVIIKKHGKELCDQPRLCKLR